MNDTTLTKREVEILSTIAEGATNDEIADRFFISPHTVKSHLYNIYKKIGLSNRLQAALWARRNL
jgi:LuxR family transcriptional regulator of csgAB operon